MQEGRRKIEDYYVFTNQMEAWPTRWKMEVNTKAIVGRPLLSAAKQIGLLWQCEALQKPLHTR